MNAIPLADFEPGGAEWSKRMTASKVAAVLGLSPWESRFSLWHRMAGLVEPEPMNDQMRRGHYLEAAVADWWQDQHPELEMGTAPGAWAHVDRPWQAATPDRLVGPRFSTATTAVLEVKTTSQDDEWGAAGTDEIPPYYRAQVIWQLDTLGLDVGYVAVLLPRLEFREYRIDYNADEAAYIRGEALAFLNSLPTGPSPRRPDLDAHSATYVAVQQMHPDISGEAVDVPDDLAREFCQAVRDLSAAKEREQAARTALADHMADAKYAKWLGKTIADRRPGRNGGTPYMQAASVKRLPLELPEGSAA